MKTASIESTEKYASVIKIMFDKFGYHYVSYEHFRDVCRDYRVGRSMPTYMVKAGILEKNLKGRIKFKDNPDFKKASIMVKKVMSDYAKKYNEKKNSLDKKVDVIPLVHSNNLPNKRQIDEQYCIDYLKAKGYKIMKPIQPQYEEI